MVARATILSISLYFALSVAHFHGHQDAGDRRPDSLEDRRHKPYTHAQETKWETHHEAEHHLQKRHLPTFDYGHKDDANRNQASDGHNTRSTDSHLPPPDPTNKKIAPRWHFARNEAPSQKEIQRIQPYRTSKGLPHISDAEADKWQSRRHKKLSHQHTKPHPNHQTGEGSHLGAGMGGPVGTRQKRDLEGNGWGRHAPPEKRSIVQKRDPQSTSGGSEGNSRGGSHHH